MAGIEHEKKWEQSMIDIGVDKYHAALDAARFRRTARGYIPMNDESATSYGISLMKEVTLPYQDYIEQFVTTAYKRMGQRDVAAAYIARCDVREVAYIAAKTIIDSISVMVNQTELAFRIAGKIEDQVRLTRFHEDYKYYFESLCDDMKRRGVKNYRHKRKVLTHCHIKATDNAKEEGKEVREWVPWAKKDKVQIGMALIDLFIHATAMIKRVMRRAGGNTIYRIEITDLGAEFLAANKEVCQYLHPECLPTLIPPKDWSTPWNGGYHTKEMRRRKPLVGMKAYTRAKHSDLLRNAEMPEVYSAVNAAQRTAWEVNEFVLDQFTEEVRARGIGFPANINEPEPLSPHPVPERGSLNDVQYQVLCDSIRASLSSEEQKELGEWRAAKRDWCQRRQSNIGKVLALTNCLKIGKKLAMKDRFYYVHTLDSRGRIYAAGTHVNPQGADAAKGMLQFADATPLGKHGYWHLCIHAAGLFGVDKVPLEDRVAWVHKHAKRIMDTWQDPAGNRDFWGIADKPYCFLAVCKELAEIWMFNGQAMLTIVSKYELEETACNYMSKIPVSQDGSCNGLQHFSAMLRDPVGAAAVNLTSAPSSAVPSDIYGECATLVLSNMEKDLENDQVLDGSATRVSTDEERVLMRVWMQKLKVDRKLCKRSTMIIPYGGQKTSCLADVKEILAEKLEKLDKAGTPIEWTSLQRKQAAFIIHHYVWAALDVIVVAARKAMRFLSRCATVNVRHNRGFYWTTPVGFVAYQDYKDPRQVTVQTKINGRMMVKYSEPGDDVHKARMRNAFPPNYVHSLDAAHLVTTVNKALDVGIDQFGLVHDSYAVPAGQTELFHKLIRESFVGQYNKELLYRLLLEFKGQFPEQADEYPDLAEVEPGPFNIDEVLYATYFFR